MSLWVATLVAVLLMVPATVAAQERKGNFQKGDYGYLYCHMNDRGRAWTAYALSRDGMHYHVLPFSSIGLLGAAALAAATQTDNVSNNTYLFIQNTI